MIPPSSIAPWTHEDNGPTRSDVWNIGIGGSVPLSDNPANSINMGSCFYWPSSTPSRSKAYYAVDDALDAFDERWQEFGYNITNGLRTLARKIDDKFGGKR